MWSGPLRKQTGVVLLHHLAGAEALVFSSSISALEHLTTDDLFSASGTGAGDAPAEFGDCDVAALAFQGAARFNRSGSVVTPQPFVVTRGRLVWRGAGAAAGG